MTDQYLKYDEGVRGPYPQNASTGSREAVQIGVTGDALNSIDSFSPSSYTGKITTDATGVSFAIATGATKLLLQSLEVTGIEEYAVLAFGTSAANAISNLTVASAVGTTGVIIRSGDSTAGGLAPDHIIKIPGLATHAAIVNGVSGLAQIIMVTQGT